MTGSEDFGLDTASAVPGAGAEECTPASGGGGILLRALWDVGSAALVAVVIAMMIHVFVAQAIVVAGPSMRPTLDYGQQVMVEKITYRFAHGPRRGDVVVVDVPNEETPLIKRVIALAGETVEVRGGRVLVNGRLLDEPWDTRQGGADYPATRIPPLHVFVLGDNRASSRDSRVFGPVSVDHIVGRAWFVYWPPDQVKMVP